MLFIIIYLLS